MTLEAPERAALFSKLKARFSRAGALSATAPGKGTVRNRSAHPKSIARTLVRGRNRQNDDHLRCLFRRHSYIFDASWYSKRHRYEKQAEPDKAINVVIDHLLEMDDEGAHTPSPLFDPRWYSIAHFGVWNGSVPALTHFLTTGAEAGLQPSPYFETSHYETRYDAPVKRRGERLSRNALEDYLLFGEQERLSPNRWFDEIWYVDRDLQLQRDIAAGALSSGFRHFIEIGARERRDPGPCFAERRYLGANQDVAAAVTEAKLVSGFDHWLRWGQFEERSLGSESIDGHTLIGAY